MEYSFTCYGHENVTCKHKTTLEFTKDPELRLQGDCIAGVKADFSLKELKKFIKTLKNKKITIMIETITDNSIKNSNKKEYNEKINNRINKTIKQNNNKNSYLP